MLFSWKIEGQGSIGQRSSLVALAFRAAARQNRVEAGEFANGNGGSGRRIGAASERELIRRNDGKEDSVRFRSA
jgi:hypothetical protein